MDSYEQMEGLGAQTEALNETMGQSAEVADGFNASLARMKKVMAEMKEEIATLESGISNGLNSAIRGAVIEGDSLSEALRKLAQSMIGKSFDAAVQPMTEHIADKAGKLLEGLLPFENGASFAQGRVQPFASGGIVRGPTVFPMRGGTGLMGEAGPEAIMPLSRGADGKLGVRAEGGGRPVNVVMNIHTPDAESFRRSRGQIAAQLGRAIGRGNRNR